MLSNRLACLLVLVSACAAPLRYTGVDDLKYSLSLNLETHSLLNREEALRACDEWLPKGVVCRTVKAGVPADIDVSINDAPCAAGPDGMYTLAIAYPDGRIVFMEKCFRRPDGFDYKKFRAVMTHEIGHQVGIWQHVPTSCAGEPLRHPTGGPVCGRAVMNAVLDEGITYITVIDGLAFDLRNQEVNSLRPLSFERMSNDVRFPTCVYRSK